ncbi:MAG: hypothetical protein JSV65_05695 [Armatimonadota bacterium]|nr:MAG: hypothetical protein JSV65_05695 [Armatimonadota bacterium]
MIDFEVILITVAVVSGGLAFWLWRAGDLKRSLARSREKVLVGPETGFYQGMIGGIISAKTYGVIALTDRRLIFRKPIGRDTEIPLSDIAEIRDDQWFAGNYRGGRKFLILKLTDGTETAFQVKNHDGWMRELGSGLSAA